MSKICLEFLYNSFLYHLDLCEAQYRGFSDKDLLDEIERYREYVLENIGVETVQKKFLNPCLFRDVLARG